MEMEDWLMRQRLLIGDDACRKLERSTVAVIGLGGVGGACVEALCRCGVGNLVLVDHDTVDLTNLNRQLIATRSVIGLPKAEACRRRIMDINPSCEVISLEQMCIRDSYWWRWVFPSIALSFATISINLIGDGLRDAIDPKSAER